MVNQAQNASVVAVLVEEAAETGVAAMALRTVPCGVTTRGTGPLM